jgi:hypothetical protein
VAHTFTETVGIITGVIAHLENADNAAALTAKDFPVANRLTRLKAKLTKINGDNAEQERRKTALSQQTDILNVSVEDGYTDASGAIDAIGDAYGKTSDAAKNVQKIRSNIRRGPSPQPPTPPPA